MTTDLAALVIRWAAATVLAVSGAAKLRSRATLTSTVESLRLVPTAVARLLAPVIVMMELGLAILLISGRWLTLSLIAAAGLFTAFAVVSLRAHREGRSESCGCLGETVELNAPLVLVVMNLIMSSTLVVGAAWAGSDTPGLEGPTMVVLIGLSITVGMAFWLVTYAATIVKALQERTGNLPTTIMRATAPETARPIDVRTESVGQ